MRALEFNYTNHKGQNHTYTVLPLSVGFGENKLYPSDSNSGKSWNLSAFVLERDGIARNVVRTFAIMKMTKVAEVPLAT